MASSIRKMNQHYKAAKGSELCKAKRKEKRQMNRLPGAPDGIKLSSNALEVLKERYLLRDEKGEAIETPSGMFRRVAKAVAEADRLHGKNADVKKAEEEFHSLMASLTFLPNSPTLMNAGTSIGQLSACFVLPAEDSLEGIFGTLKDMVLVHQSGGGTGFSFSKLRPKGDIVGPTHGVASGPLSFMQVYDSATNVVKQGGRRRGANMAILSVYHPDILDFISAKQKQGAFSNFNFSVAVDSDFMKAAEKGKEYSLINPRTGKEAKRLKAADVFGRIVSNAWESGDPGLVFIDRINKDNPTPHLGMIESTNPCGEVPLLPYESCNLGSINLTKFVRDGKFGWKGFAKTVPACVHFLDNVIDQSRYPIEKIDAMTRSTRKIGLGVMGFADALLLMGVKYDSAEAEAFAKKLMRMLTEEARKASEKLGRQRGDFPEFKKSALSKRYRHMRNATVTAIAPTGTISLIAGCSSGIEPIFAVSFVRNVLGGARLVETNPHFVRKAKEMGFYSEELAGKIAKTGSLRPLDVPEEVKELFVVAHDIAPEWHVKIQAAFQEFTDNGVSKTINLPENAKPEDVRSAFLLAYSLGCKGVTAYRYGSKPGQVLTFGNYALASRDFSGGCPYPYCRR